ncbi:hypothetical protein ACP4OV_013247 [Aristida adscensionis]
MGRRRARKRRRGGAEAGEEAAGEGEGEEEGEEAALFPVGAEVEVRSDDPGFVGSFYEATVAGYHPGGRGYVVAYSTLTRREDGGSPVREHAAAADVRPRPPPPPPAREYAVHEMVEAFHNDGWWAGVVCAVPPPPAVEAAAEPPRRVYTVCFPTSREVLEFEAAALRPHRVFRGDRWVPAAEAENETPMFREGSQVEVSRSAKTFGEYWNPATIQKVIGATSFLVQYRHVTEDGELTTEILDSQYIRPARNIILMDSKYRFTPSSHAEVLHEGSWWPGVILKVLDDERTKKYVVKINSQEAEMDDVENVDVLTVEHTQLRPRYDWYGKKWVRHITKKPVNVGSQLTSRRRPPSAVLASCNHRDDIAVLASCDDSKKIAVLASYNGSHEIKDTSGSYHSENVMSPEVILGPLCSDSLAHNENDKFQPKISSYPEELVKTQNPVLALKSPLILPSQLSVTGFGHLKYDPNVQQGGQHQLSYPQMIATPAVQTGQFQASLFGTFGQLRPLPQGPIGIQSFSPGFSSIGEAKKLVADQEKRTTDKDYYAEPNFNDGSFFGTDTSRKRRKECVPFQSQEELGSNPKIMLTRKKIVRKIVKGTSNAVVASLDPIKSKNDTKEVLPTDGNPGSGILREINTVTSMDFPVENNKGSQESIFLRESTVVDAIIPSGIPIVLSELHQSDSVGAPRPAATKLCLLVEDSVLSVTSTLHKSGDANVLLADSSTQYESKATEAEKFAINMEEDDAGKEFCQKSLALVDDASVDLVHSSENHETTWHDQQLCNDNMTAMVECTTTCVVPYESVSIMSLAAVDGAVPNLLTSSNNCEANKKDYMERLCNNMPETDEQHGVSQKHHSLNMVESAADREGSQSMQKSELTQLSSCEMNNSTEVERGNIVTAAKDAEGTPTSKYVPGTVHDSCRPLLQRSMAVHESIIADRPSESLAVENLPFVKTSPMWPQIEAMEIFSEVPQQPNFHQFKQEVPELREGMALGLMFSFANLAESIKKMQAQDENALFEEKMQGLSSLEAHGFDVRHLRSRLEALLHIKNRRAELKDAIKELEEKIAQEEIGNRQLDTQIGMLNTTVRELELHACLLRCVMQSAVSQKINHALEISKLKAEASNLQRSYLCVEEADAAPR